MPYVLLLERSKNCPPCATKTFRFTSRPLRGILNMSNNVYTEDKLNQMPSTQDWYLQVLSPNFMFGFFMLNKIPCIDLSDTGFGSLAIGIKLKARIHRQNSSGIRVYRNEPVNILPDWIATGSDVSQCELCHFDFTMLSHKSIKDYIST